MGADGEATAAVVAGAASAGALAGAVAAVVAAAGTATTGVLAGAAVVEAALQRLVKRRHGYDKARWECRYCLEVRCLLRGGRRFLGTILVFVGGTFKCTAV